MRGLRQGNYDKFVLSEHLIANGFIKETNVFSPLWIKKPNESPTIFKKIVTLLDKRSKECIPKFLITYGKPKIPQESTKYIGVAILCFQINRLLR